MGIVFFPHELADLRSKSAKVDLTTQSHISFDKTVELCRRYLHRLVTRDLNVTSEKAREQTHADIANFVNNLRDSVAGYVGRTEALITSLQEEITDYGVITKLLKRNDVDEVRVNGKRAIFYQKGGITYAYRKRFFTSDEDLKQVVDKLLGTEVRLSKGEPFKNSSSIEGWRINAIDKSISNFNEYGLVIRKPKSEKLAEADLIDSQTMTYRMASLLRLLPLARASWFTVGPTGSGKTLLNEIIASNIRPNDRTILVENPSELRFIQYTEDEERYIRNDFLQLLASNPHKSADDSMVEPTVNNLLENALRQTPVYFAAGEIRNKEEFRTVLIGLQTDHKAFTTFHASGAQDACRRYLTNYLAASPGEPPELVMSNLCNNVDFIVTTALFPHLGRRKITEIAEIVGSSGQDAKVNIIYEYEPDDVGDDGYVTSRFIRRNALSPAFIKKLRYAGIPYSQYSYWATAPADPNGDVELTMREESISSVLQGDAWVEEDPDVEAA